MKEFFPNVTDPDERGALIAGFFDAHGVPSGDTALKTLSFIDRSAGVSGAIERGEILGMGKPPDYEERYDGSIYLSGRSPEG